MRFYSEIGKSQYQFRQNTIYVYARDDGDEVFERRPRSIQITGKYIIKYYNVPIYNDRGMY